MNSEILLAIPIPFPKIIAHMGVTATCASLVALKVPAPLLLSKRSNWECFTPILQKDTSQDDLKEKVMKTRGRSENVKTTGF